MRLLSTQTGKLHEFFDEKTPLYAILSHTWGDGEVSLQDLERGETTNKAGYSKIKSCCELAASEGWKYVWIDTCCIDKSSSAELSEAINSMFRWYQRAEVCYVYLSDVDSKGTTHSPPSIIHDSRWFTRGWTLQELLAPAVVVFYDKHWTEIGTKRSLQKEISSETGIQHDHLFSPMDACIAVKMSWASRRTTARREDIAYCLLGLFDLNMPLLYGEGEKAFFRLQYELLQSGGDDESIFAWEDVNHQFFMYSGILAPSPAAFASSGNIEKLDIPYGHRLVSNLTRKSMLAVFLVPQAEVAREPEDSSFRDKLPFITLRCERKTENGICLGFKICKRPWQRYYLRANPRNLTKCQNHLNLYQASRSEEVLLSGQDDSGQYPLIDKQSTIGLKWPALQIDPCILSAHELLERRFKMESSVESGCWTLRHVEDMEKIVMMFTSGDDERFLIVVGNGSFGLTENSVDVVISNSISIPKALRDLRGFANPTKDIVHGVLQRGSQLTVKSRKNAINDHICHMIHVDVIGNHSPFEFKGLRAWCHDELYR